MTGKNNISGMMIAVLAVAAGVGVTLFARWEPGGETWGYWFFARVFAETGKFPIVERGPLYCLYLNLFRLMHYPASLITEYVVTSFMTAAAFIFFFRRYIGLFGSVLAFLLWLPFLQFAEPPVQKLALAFSFFALMSRGDGTSKFRLSLSYAFLGLAYLVRGTYLIFILVFGVWDCIRAFRQGKFRGLADFLRPSIVCWPLIMVLALFMWFKSAETSHPWNNIWFTSTNWYPADGKKQGDSTFIHNYNWQYIFYKYGSFKDKDFYFTNKELFNGAKDIAGAVRANPGFVAEQMTRNIRAAFYSVADYTLFYKIFFGYFIPTVLFALAVLYGAFCAARGRKDIVVFIIANVLVLGTAVVALPKGRYFVPLIPILVLSAYWYGDRAREILSSRRFSASVAFFAIPLALVIFSNGVGGWKTMIKNIAGDIKARDVRIMESRPYSVKASFKTLEPLFSDCKGAMSLEATFYGAFTGIPLDRNYDVWEIPPFGKLGDAEYKGLTPERVDCVIVSHELATGMGAGINFQLRYDNYIKPYIKELQDKGAKVYDIKDFGEVFALSSGKSTGEAGKK